MKKVILLSVLLSNLLLTACNTMEGFGQDIQTGGKAIERSAQENSADARAD